MLKEKWNVTLLLGNFGGEHEFLDFYRALLSLECSPLSLVVGIFPLFCHFKCEYACLQAQGLARGLAMSACHMMK